MNRPGSTPFRRPVLRAACALVLVMAAAPAARPEEPDAGAQGRAIYGRIRGTVLGPARKGLAGLLVQLSARGDSGLLRVTGTNDKGQYLFQELPAGTYDIDVAAEGFVAQKKGSIVVRPPFQNIVDFEMRPATGAAGAGPATGRVGEPPGAGGAAPAGSGSSSDAPPPRVPVRGQLVDQQKRPVAEVSITFVSLEGRGDHQAFSGEEGRFNLPAIPAGRYRVLVASPGHVALDLKSIEVSPTAGLNLSLSLVDYSLNFKGGREDALPREEPRPAPSATPSP
jgi:hypothetical protein